MASTPINPPPYRLPLVEDTGRITEEWYKWLTYLYNRVGGSAGTVGSGNDTYIINTAAADLPNAQVLSVLASGFVKVTTTTGILTSEVAINAATELTGAVPIANGGTASTSASTARTALGLAIGTNVQAHSSALDTVSSSGNISGNAATSTTCPSGTSTGNNTGDQSLTGLLLNSNNLSDVSSASTSRSNLGIKTNTASLNFGTVTSGSAATGNITVTGANVNDVVMLGLPVVTTGMIVTGYVSSSNTVTVVCTNCTSGSLTQGTATYRASIIND